MTRESESSNTALKPATVVPTFHRLHLAAALLSVTGILLLLVAFNVYADALSRRYIHIVAPAELEQAAVGLAWQRAAFQTGDLLPIYGSSELDHQTYEGEYHGSNFFKTYPSGFTIFPIGAPGNTCIIMLQDLAALGTDVRGKKVAISFSPPWFIRPGAQEIRKDHYAGNFSRLHAYALVFGDSLSWELKHQIAARMLDYRSTYRKDALLEFALQRLAKDSPASRLLYTITVPVGKLITFVMTQQDKFETVLEIWSHPEWNPEITRQPQTLDWDTILAQAARQAEANANNNPYGFYNQLWTTRGERLGAESQRRTDEEFIETVRTSPDWRDCELLLETLAELGAQPLVLSQPIKGAYFKELGVSYKARRAFYVTQQQLLETRDFPFVTFADHDDDLHFVADPFSHLSPKGWAYYDSVLDAFFRNALQLP